MRTDSVRAALLALAGLVCFLSPRAVSAQARGPGLTPKRTLAQGVAPGCPVGAVAPPSATRRDAAEARRLATEGQEAALLGDQQVARDAYLRAAALDPSDERIAYELGRALEEVADTTRAVDAFCRFLVLAPDGGDADDARARLARLIPAETRRRADDALVAFRLGLGDLDAQRWQAAAEAFDNVVRLVPSSLEARYNRGLALSASGRRDAARRDLEAYQAAAPSVDDRVAVAQALEVLRRPVYQPFGAFARGIVPGLGQFYTGRPVRGLIVLALVGGAGAAAIVEQITVREVAYIDPNGFPAPYTERTRERPYLVPALSAAAGLTLAAAIEAAVVARRSQRDASILAPSLTGRRTSLGLWTDPRGATGIALRIDGAFGGSR